jgi:hypothetical protein
VAGLVEFLDEFGMAGGNTTCMLRDLCRFTPSGDIMRLAEKRHGFLL